MKRHREIWLLPWIIKNKTAFSFSQTAFCEVRIRRRVDGWGGFPNFLRSQVRRSPPTNLPDVDSIGTRHTACFPLRTILKSCRQRDVLPLNVTLAILSPFPRRWATVFRWTTRAIISPQGAGAQSSLAADETCTAQSQCSLVLFEVSLSLRLDSSHQGIVFHTHGA